MDSRYGNSKTLGKESPTTLIDETPKLDDAALQLILHISAVLQV